MSIRPFFEQLARRLRLFAIARDGVAAVEFGLVLPVMLLLYVGSIELSDLINVDRRVTVIAGTIGDLVARTDGSLDTADLTDYFNAAERIITPYKSTGLKQLVTSVFVDAAGIATVRWSKGSGGAIEKANNAVLNTAQVPNAIRDISRGKYVIMSETAYSYKPLMGLVFQNDVALYRQNFHLPRHGEEITLD